jgi:hypothetical protein
MSEKGNDELLAEAGALEEVERQRAEDIERERAEEARTASAAPADDGGTDLEEA